MAKKKVTRKVSASRPSRSSRKSTNMTTTFAWLAIIFLIVASVYFVAHRIKERAERENGLKQQIRNMLQLKDDDLKEVVITATPTPGDTSTITPFLTPTPTPSGY